MATFNLNRTYKHLLVAPSSLQDEIIKRIEREKMKAESFQPCGIFMKMNSLTDRKIIDELSKASTCRCSDISSDSWNLLYPSGNSRKDRKYQGGEYCRKIFRAFKNLCIWSWRRYRYLYFISRHDDKKYKKTSRSCSANL